LEKNHFFFCLTGYCRNIAAENEILIIELGYKLSLMQFEQFTDTISSAKAFSWASSVNVSPRRRRP
jgi:hypothetical protein